MRKFYWYLTAYLKKHGLIFFASVLGAILVFSFIVPQVAQSLEKRQRSYVGIVGQYTLNNLPPRIKSKLSTGLTKVSPDGSVMPLLAERWSVEQDGKTYRFILKEGLYWNDGTPLKPEDINYNLQEVETIITPNDIVFKLPDAYAPFPVVVAEPLLKSSTMPHYFFFSRPTLVGIGEFRITDYQRRGQDLTELTIDSKDERIVYRFYPTEEDAVDAFKHGKVDFLPELSKEYDVMEWDTAVSESKLNTARYLAVFFNIRNSLFSKNVRQALSYALEKPPADIRASGPINPQSWAYLEGGKSYDKDLQRASERLLDEVPSVPLEFELTTTAVFQEEAESIKQQWEEFGQKAYDDCRKNNDIKDKNLCENVKIQVHLKVTNFPDTSDFQALLIGQESLPDPDQYYLWHSDQSTNFSGYKNTRIDNLLEKGRQTLDKKERTDIYQEFQQFFLEDTPAIFLRYLYSYDIKRG